MYKLVRVLFLKEAPILKNRTRKISALLCAVLIFSGTASVFAPSTVSAAEKTFAQSAYTFEYENLLLDVGDGTYPLIEKENKYTTVSGRDGGKASSSGAVLSPEMFTGKDELTLSFWTVYTGKGGGDSTSPYKEANDLIASMNEKLNSIDPAKYTSSSLTALKTAVASLESAVKKASPENIVSAMEKVASAESELRFIYSKSEAEEILSDAKSIDLTQYTSSTAGAVNNAINQLSDAILANSVEISSLANSLIDAVNSLEFTSYLKQAQKEYGIFAEKYEGLCVSIYSSESVSALNSAISALSSAIKNSESDASLKSKVAAVESAFSDLQAVSGAESAGGIFYADGGSSFIKIGQSAESLVLNINLGSSSDNSESALSEFAKKSEYAMITLTLRATSSSKVALSLYINGTQVESRTLSGDLSAFSCKTAEFSSAFAVDDIYVASKALSSSECKNLYEKSMEDFLRLMDPDWVKPSDRIDIKPVTNFKWSAYTFDNGLKIDSDLNGVAACSYNAIKLAPVDTSAYGGSYGMGLARRGGIYPSYYLSLANGLLYSAESFTVAGYVYTPSGTTSASFFEFSGKGGKLIFSPFSSMSSGQANAYFEYTDSSGNTKRESFPGGKLGNIASKWTHYALTFAQNGDVTVYVDGKSAATVNTGLKLSSLSLNNFKIISGITAGESARIIIDDIYISSKVMSDSDIRKLSYYGVERFVGEVLPDPETGEINKPEEEINLSSDETDALEDEYSDVAAINGYVGTTFDDSSFLGEDYNGSVAATVRNASLVQGLYKYGLNLNGKTAYVRYPKEIFNSVSELTVSIAYNWITPSSLNERNQKLFSFSNKDSSVADPKAYMYLDMGDGTSGMKFVISDGNSTTEIKTGINNINEWKRITVTIKDGNIKLYLDTDLIAQKSTDADLTQIAPNFNYIGKSGYKGDPLFCGVVDEIYLSDREISSDEIKSLMTGIVPAEKSSEDAEKGSGDVWDGILIGTLIFMGLLLAAFIGFVVYMLFFRKNK